MHLPLLRHWNCPGLHPSAAGQSGGSSLPSRQSGERSQTHRDGMHFFLSAHWKLPGPQPLPKRWCCPSPLLRGCGLPASWSGETPPQPRARSRRSGRRRFILLPVSGGMSGLMTRSFLRPSRTRLGRTERSRTEVGLSSSAIYPLPARFFRDWGFCWVAFYPL